MRLIKLLDNVVESSSQLKQKTEKLVESELKIPLTSQIGPTEKSVLKQPPSEKDALVGLLN